MSVARKLCAALCLALAVAAGLGAGGASAAGPAPAWSIHSVAVPTNFVPGDNAKDYFYEITIANSGGGVTDGSPIALTDTLPAGLEAKKVELLVRSSSSEAAAGGILDYGATACGTETTGATTTARCVVSEGLPKAIEPARLHPSEELRMVVHVSTPGAASGALENVAEVQGGGAAPATVTSANRASAEPVHAGFSEFHADLLGEAGETATQAASHPYEYTTSFAVNTAIAAPGSLAPFVPAEGDLKTISVALPPGLVGNPNAALKCTAQEFNERHSVVLEGGANIFQNGCPDGSAIGLVVVQQVEGVGQVLPLPLYNLVPPKGMPAQFGFQLAGAPIFIDTRVRTGDDYGITAFLPNTSEAKRVTAASVTIWGTPAAPSHDRLRGDCLNSTSDFSVGECPAEIAPVPFLRLPTGCGSALQTEMSFDNWTSPGTFLGAPLTTPAPEGCGGVDFKPTIAAVPQSSTADSPTGLAFNLHVPQDEDPAHLAVADLRDVTVTLPQGVSVNPASAGGLGTCSLAQIELGGEAPATCPDASKIGSVEVKTPLLDHPVNGGVFLARQSQNPFGSLLAIYVAAFDPQSGVVLKLAGKVETDETTGQITTRFVDNPQLPFEDLTVTFFDGPRAPLRTPARCGEYTTTTAMTPYSAPGSGADATPSDSFTIDRGPGESGACPTGGVAASMAAGLRSATAGSHSPFDLALFRPSGSDELLGVNVAIPPGVLATLRGVPYCPDGAIAAAQARRQPGEGALEAASPSCPAASAVGSASAGAGAGPEPVYTHGQVYLAGPYKGAPLSLVAVIPAIAGPFDLGVVVDRIALRVDPTTAQVTAESDPFPRILAGIPLDVRDIRVDLDRPNFTIAPTNCEPNAVRATVLGVGGGSASLSYPFQARGCDRLPFSPSLSVALTGKTGRVGHPALRAVLQAVPGQANIARTVVALPASEQIENAHVNNPCTRPQFAAGQCPERSILGHASATSPLLDQPLEGNVYFRANGGEHPLPDIVADLNGQIHIVLVGHIDSVHGRVRTSFETVPDAPVEQFTIELFGDSKGLLVNTVDLCRARHRAQVQMDAQNGRVHDFEPVVKTTCRKKRKPPRRKPTRHHHHH